MDSLIPESALNAKGRKVSFKSVFPKHDKFETRLQRADQVLQRMKRMSVKDLGALAEANDARLKLANDGLKLTKASWQEMQACMDATTIAIMCRTPLVHQSATKRSK